VVGSIAEMLAPILPFVV